MSILFTLQILRYSASLSSLSFRADSLSELVVLLSAESFESSPFDRFLVYSKSHSKLFNSTSVMNTVTSLTVMDMVWAFSKRFSLDFCRFNRDFMINSFRFSFFRSCSIWFSILTNCCVTCVMRGLRVAVPFRILHISHLNDSDLFWYVQNEQLQ